MAIETISGGRNYRDPSYWANHYRGDECPITGIDFKLLSDSSDIQNALLLLGRFFSHDLRSPFRRLDPGQIFDPTNFDLGTVVRFYQESLVLHSINHPESQFEGEINTHWGVVLNCNQAGNTRSLVHVLHEPLNRPGIVRDIDPVFFYLKDSSFTIGEVRHNIASSSSSGGNTTAFEDVSRVTSLEIMKAG